MKIEIKESVKLIEVGDIVHYQVLGGVTCLVSYDMLNDEYPYRLVSLKDCKIVNGYVSLELINNSDAIRLLAKSDEIIISNYVDSNGNVW